MKIEVVGKIAIECENENPMKLIEAMMSRFGYIVLCFAPGSTYVIGDTVSNFMSWCFGCNWKLTEECSMSDWDQQRQIAQELCERAKNPNMEDGVKFFKAVPIVTVSRDY